MKQKFWLQNQKKTDDRWICHKFEQNSAHIKTNILTWKEKKDDKVSELKSRKKLMAAELVKNVFRILHTVGLLICTLIEIWEIMVCFIPYKNFRLWKPQIFQGGNLEKSQVPPSKSLFRVQTAAD